MKIAFTCQGETLEAALDMRFGRAKNFLIYDTVSGDFKIVANIQNLNAAQGAGIQAAMTVVSSGAEVVVTGHCGPKAFLVLEEAGIKVYTAGAGSISAALKAFEEGELKQLAAADVEGHWV